MVRMMASSGAWTQQQASRQPCTLWAAQVSTRQAAVIQAAHHSSSSRRGCGGKQQRCIMQQQRAVSRGHEIVAHSSYNEASTSTPATSTDGDYGYMQEYAALKQQLLNNTRQSGGAIGLYLLFTVNGAAALAAMVGTAASYAYVSWLCRDVDNVKPTDTVPIWEANKIENVWLRRAAKLRAAYQKALTPRLLIPVGLGCLVGIYSKVTGEQPDLVYSGSLLLGFLSYKAALVLKLIDDLSPKSFTPQAERPTIEKFDDELDQWGRPKKRLSNPIDVMPEDAQQKAYEQLEKQMEREQAREQ